MDDMVLQTSGIFSIYILRLFFVECAIVPILKESNRHQHIIVVPDIASGTT